MAVDADILIDYPEELLSYMRNTRKGIFHNSNVFFRDLQFAIQDYFEDQEGETISMVESEQIAKEVARSYESLGVFKKVNPQGYVLQYPDFITPKDGGTAAILNTPYGELPPPAPGAVPAKAAPAAATKPAPAAKPAAAAPTVASATPNAETVQPGVTHPVDSKPGPAAAVTAASAPQAGAMPAGAKVPPPWLKK
jgi:hypothetical protein